MTISDFNNVITWWLYLFLLGLPFLPITKTIFSDFFDKGYIFSKTLGIIFLSYTFFILSVFHVLPFERQSIFLIFVFSIFLNFFLFKRFKVKLEFGDLKIFIFQELFFLLALLFWSYIKGFQPDIHGLEKFMDFGFMNSILRSEYLPPVDMWFPPHTINYYYFGHFVTAVLMKMTNISPFVSYNLMLATIFAFTATGAFSIVTTLTKALFKNRRTIFLSGILASLLLTLAGNLQTIYAFFVPYTPAENPVPFWDLQFAPSSFPNGYWYPNATRFIPFTIHEFPSYSFVVSDLHGHVLDIPFVLLTIAIFLSLFLSKKLNLKITIFISFLLSVMYMTNAWDGIIYFGLFSLSVLFINWGVKTSKKTKSTTGTSPFFKRIADKSSYLTTSLTYILIAGVGFFILSLPFNRTFSPFASKVGVICSPEFLMDPGPKITTIGPILLEPDHCQRTPLWMFFILYGFFYLFILTLIFKVLKIKRAPIPEGELPPGILEIIISYVYLFIHSIVTTILRIKDLPRPILFVIIISIFSTLLIIAPEFIYAKDIYPQHYRANTVFKLGYQAYIMLTLATAFSITYILNQGRKVIWIPVILILLTLNLSYAFFAINSYFAELKEYKGLDGLSYLKNLYPDDYDAIHWIQENIDKNPVILESQGDSYTDHGRISANTGLPTVLGWTVHEWLWRGEYSIPAARLDDVRALYEDDINKTESLISKYNIEYVYVGTLERTKYPAINEVKFEELGDVIYQKGTVNVYKLIKE